MNEPNEEPTAPVAEIIEAGVTAEAVEPTEAAESVGQSETAETVEPAEAVEGETAEAGVSAETPDGDVDGAPHEAPVAEASGPAEQNPEAAGAEEETGATPSPRRRRERRPTERTEMESAIEAILFVSSEPVPRARLVELFDEEDRPEAEGAIDAVLERFAATVGRGFMAEEVAGGVRLATRPELVGWLRRFFDVSSGTKLSMAALETLAIVAYRQPITGPEIQELRSVSASGTLKTLLERRLVRIAGRKEVVGKPFLYGTTREFLVHFGLKSLADLPPLEEFEETFGSDSNLVDRSLGAQETDSASAEPAERAEPEGAAVEAGEPAEAAIATLSAADESRERELIAAHEAIEEIEEREQASASAEAGSHR